jgi:hypothetical protein
MIGLGIGVPRIRFVTAGGISAPPLLLDTYSGAAAAYSLRGLSTPYINSANPYACQVRNSSNVPLNIGFVFNSLTGDYELDTTALLAHCAGGNGFVDVWYDQSSNVFDVTQTIALNQPQIVSSGSVILDNGKPSVQFDGINDSLLLPSNLYNNWSVSQVSALIIANITNVANRAIFQMNNAAGNRLAFGRADISANYGWRNNGIYQKTYNDSSLNQVLGSIYTAASKIYINNNEAITAENAPASSTLSFGRIGGTNFSATAGTTQEIIIYNTDQSSNRIGIETNINSFYSIY